MVGFNSALWFRMKKEKLILAFKEAILNNNVSKRTGNRIEILSNNGNALFIDKSTPSMGIYLEGMKEKCVIGITDVEKYELTDEEYSDLVNIYNELDQI